MRYYIEYGDNDDVRLYKSSSSGVTLAAAKKDFLEDAKRNLEDVRRDLNKAMDDYQTELNAIEKVKNMQASDAIEESYW